MTIRVFSFAEHPSDPVTGLTKSLKVALSGQKTRQHTNPYCEYCGDFVFAELFECRLAKLHVIFGRCILSQIGIRASLLVSG